MPEWSLPAVLALVYLTLHVFFLLTARHRPASRGRLLLTDAVLMAAMFGLLWFTRDVQGGLRLALRLWGPILFFWWAYTWAGRVLHVYFPAQRSIDGLLIRWEERLFGQPSLYWARHGGRRLTEVMHVLYAGYYLYTPLVGLPLHLTGRLRDFESMSFAVLFGYLVSYSLFTLVPVWGPRWGLVQAGLLEPSRQILQGYWTTSVMNRIMYQGVAHKGGAMPSSHSSTAVVFLVWSWRIWGPEGGIVALIAVAGMWAGSIYGRYHYLLDVLVGALLGLLSVQLADALHR